MDQCGKNINNVLLNPVSKKFNFLEGFIMVKTLVVLGTVSVASYAIEAILYNIGKHSAAQYVGLAGTSFIGLTALKGVQELLKFVLSL